MDFPLNILDEQIFSHKTFTRLASGDYDFEFFNPTFNFNIHPDIPKGTELAGWSCCWLHDNSVVIVKRPMGDSIVFKLKLFANFDEQLTKQLNHERTH